MGYDLTNAAGEYHQWKSLGWWHLLNLAKSYGWVPQGTQAPDEMPDKWDGNYFRNEGQKIAAADASELAVALERLLADSQREATARSVGQRLEAVAGDESIVAGQAFDDVLTYPLDFVREMFRHFGAGSVGTWNFDESSNRYLRQLISFCRKGPLTIQ